MPYHLSRSFSIFLLNKDISSLLKGEGGEKELDNVLKKGTEMIGVCGIREINSYSTSSGYIFDKGQSVLTVNDIRDSFSGNTMLHGAARHGNIKMVAKLLEYGADVTAKNNNGKTAADVSDGIGYDLRNAISPILDETEREAAFNRWREEHGQEMSSGGFASRIAGSLVCGSSRSATR